MLKQLSYLLATFTLSLRGHSVVQWDASVVFKSCRVPVHVSPLFFCVNLELPIILYFSFLYLGKKKSIYT